MAALPTSLSDLPNELVDLVGSYAQPTDLLNLRLTNKDIAAKTLRVMTPKCFGELHIMVAFPHSLKRAAAVASHAYLGRHIHSVTVHLDAPFEHPDIQWRTDGLGAWSTANDASEIKRLQGVHEEWRRAAEELACTTADQRSLTAIFRALSRRNRPISLCLRSGVSGQHIMKGQAPADYRTLASVAPTNIRLALAPREQCDGYLSSILTTARKSNIRLCSLDILGSSHAWFGAPISLFSGVIGSANFRPTLQPLKVMKLYIPSVWNRQDDQDMVTDQGLSTVVSFLEGSVPNLAVLELSGGFDPGNIESSPLSRLVGHMIQHLRIPHLQSLRLKNARIRSSAELIGFLERHGSTLESYHFDSVWCEDLEEGDDWSPQSAVDEWAARLQNLGVVARMDGEPALPEWTFIHLV